MKPLVIFLVAFSFFLFFFSCKKNDTAKTASTIVKSYTDDVHDTTNGINHTTTTYSITYDADGRLLTVISNDSIQKNIYTYSSASKYTAEYISGQWVVHKEFFLNNLSLIDSTYAIGNSPVGSWMASEKYFYNGSGQLITRTRSENGSDERHTYSYDAIGNQTIDSCSKYNYVSTIEYSTFRYHLPVVEPYFFQSPYLVSRETKTYTNDTTLVMYTYTFDSDNRLNSFKQVIPKQRITWLRTYIY
jgi:YD repeat-containing protein